MAFRIVLPRKADIFKQMELAAQKLSPRHSIALLAKDLQATIHEPDGALPYPLRGRILPTDELWSLAAKVKECAAPQDVIFCSSEAGGFHLAAQYAGIAKRPRIAIFVHNVDRPRTKAAMRLWRMQKAIDLFIVCSRHQQEFLKRYLNLPENRVRFINDHTDDLFFTPGPKSLSKKRPMIASVGLEQRDYRTLALATSNLDIDVRISGFSSDAKANSAFPDPLPANMEKRFYEWPELVQLYRDADAIVVSCRENKYAAGVQSLMEGSACARPIIATKTTGLQSYLNDSVVTINPDSPDEMASAIRLVISNPDRAQKLASAAFLTAQNRYKMDRYVNEISVMLRQLA
jgi:glycosyltransferase involved in cell wall biosynthesis